MNRQLAEAVIAVYGDEAATIHRDRFAKFDERDWLRTSEWLHTSGLALYFLARVRTLAIEDVIPVRLLKELEGNLAENQVRMEGLFAEFVKINMEFQRARLSYANLKGFALAPRSCGDPAHRYQHDLDFLVSRRDAERCRETLERQGYRLAATFGNTWEFRAGAAEVSSMRDLYKTRSQRSLEVHLTGEDGKSHGSGDQLSRLQLQVWNGFEFPALSECDKLLGQAQHLFKHFQTEWTRTAWMLEYAAAARSHCGDKSFWQEIIAAIEAAPQMKVGIGVASLMTSRTFGTAFPAQFLASTVDQMPERVRRWVDRYADQVVYVEFPGSKLYLLLQDVLFHDRPDWHSQRRRRLIPSHLPRKEMLATQDVSVWLSVQVAYARLRFLLARLRFHVAEGLRYKIEAARWKRFVADLQA